MQPDRLEKSIRFGCGSIFGIIIGFYYSLNWVLETWGEIVAIIICSAVICGFLAVKFGDEFWHSLKSLRWWL